MKLIRRVEVPLLLFALLFGAAYGQETVDAQLNETPELWFVELQSPPTSDGGSLRAVRNEKQTFRNRAQAAGIAFQERYAYDVLFNGLSIQVNKGQISKLTTIEGVKAIYPVAVVPMPETTPAPEPELFTALAMTGADAAQSELGYTGAGIRVAVMDTGIDYDHPDLGGCFGAGCRVETGWDFVGDAFDGSNTPVPDLDPDDCAGHGTHVAGIVGASGVVTGVAPGVTFGAYRVFGCTGVTTTDIMIAAMERALADDMDILNMSIGAAFQWPQYPSAQAANRLVNKGMVVVASIGNAGANGLYSASAPGLGSKVIGVASFDNTDTHFLSFTISPDDMAIGYSRAVGAPPSPLSGSSPMARTGTKTSTADACTPLAPGSLTGMVALIRRGGCTFYLKSMNAQNAGAVGVVIYNNQPTGIIAITVAGTPPVTIPVVFTDKPSGELIDDRLAVGPVTLTWTDGVISAPNPTGGLISSFSSYGLSPDLDLKPDIGAPGGLIWSTLPLEQGAYGSLSGTSMSSPHVAGAAALLLEAKPKTPAQVVDVILQNSADPKPWWGNPGLGFLDNVHRQGAGMLDIDDAILATTKIEPSELAVGEGEAGPATRTLTIENNADADVTYDLSYVNAVSTGGVIIPSFWDSDASVDFSASSVTVPAGGTATVDVTINPATYPMNGQYGGYIEFTPQGGGQVYRVPYAGFVGDYQGIQVLVPTPAGFPWLAKLIGSTFVNQPLGATFSMIGDDIPYILVHLDHQVRWLRMEVFDANTGKAWHRAFKEDYIGRNSTPTSFFALPWDGTTVVGKTMLVVPDGQYVIKLSILKALGDGTNPAHHETWTSPVITVDRP